MTKDEEGKRKKEEGDREGEIAKKRESVTVQEHPVTGDR